MPLFAEYSLFYRALLQKRPILVRSLLIVAIPYQNGALFHKWPIDVCRLQQDATPSCSTSATAHASSSSTHCNTLQHTATRCSTWVNLLALMAHNAQHCNLLQHTVTHCNTRLHLLPCLAHTTTPCNTTAPASPLAHTATHCNILAALQHMQHAAPASSSGAHCNTLLYSYERYCNKAAGVAHDSFISDTTNPYESRPFICDTTYLPEDCKLI